jgi:hypothetical protein
MIEQRAVGDERWLARESERARDSVEMNAGRTSKNGKEEREDKATTGSSTLDSCIF